MDKSWPPDVERWAKICDHNKIPLCNGQGWPLAIIARVMKSRAAGLLLVLFLDVASFAQTSATFAIGDGGGVSFQTDGSTAAAVVAGYAKVSPTPGAQLPSGLAIMDFRANNTLVSEAGVPASGLITSGRIYAEVSSFINTGIAIANPANQTATLTFFFTDSSGD